MSENREMKVEEQRGSKNILEKTQNIQLKSNWVFDCIFSRIAVCNSSQNKKIIKNGQHHHKYLKDDSNNTLKNSEKIDKEEIKNEELRKQTIFACTRNGNLIKFEKWSDGTFQNVQNIYNSPQMEKFQRIYEDCDSIDYEKRYLLVSGSMSKVHVFQFNPNYIESNIDCHNQQRSEQYLNIIHEYIPAVNRNVYGICGFKKHSHKVFTAGAKNVCLYDIQQQKIVRRISNDIETAAVEYNRDMNVFSTCGVSTLIFVYDDRQYKHIFKLSGHNSTVVRLTTLQDNNHFFLASGSHDNSLILWDIRYQGNNKILSSHHSDAIFGLAYDPSHQILYSSSWDRSVKALDLNNFSTLATISEAQTNKIICCKYSAESGELMTSSRDGSVQFYDTL